MLFVGKDEQAGYYLRELAREHREFYEKYDGIQDDDEIYLADYVRDLIRSGEDVFIIDAASFADEERSIIQSVSRIREATNADIIICAPGFDEGSSLINDFRALGIGKITCRSRNNNTGLREDLERFLYGEAEEVTEDEQEQIIARREEHIAEVINRPQDARYDIPTAPEKVAEIANLEVEKEHELADAGEIYIPDDVQPEIAVPAAEEEPKRNNDDLLAGFMSLGGAGLGGSVFTPSVEQKKEEAAAEIEIIQPGKPETEAKEETTKAERIIKTDNNSHRLKNHKGILKIGVAGAMPRIGTTTMAMQLCKFLNVEVGDHTACYVEYNSSDYLKAVDDIFEISDRDESLGRRTFSSVDMYCEPKKINRILDQGYEYIIYDYGPICQCEENSLLEKDIVILVCGTEADEVLKTEEAIRKLQQKNVFYMFNYSTEADFVECAEALEDDRTRAYRAGYIPDRFRYDSELDDAFLSIINSEIYEVKDETHGRRKKRQRLMNTK